MVVCVYMWLHDGLMTSPEICPSSYFIWDCLQISDVPYVGNWLTRKKKKKY